MKSHLGNWHFVTVKSSYHLWIESENTKHIWLSIRGNVGVVVYTWKQHEYHNKGSSHFKIWRCWSGISCMQIPTQDKIRSMNVVAIRAFQRFYVDYYAQSNNRSLFTIIGYCPINNLYCKGLLTITTCSKISMLFKNI